MNDAPSPLPPPDSGISSVIPYKNVPALIGYYCGVFSLIPCLGGMLGWVALVLGIIGLKRAKENPTARGKVHAWIGIILGGLCGLANLALGAVPLIAAWMERRG